MLWPLKATWISDIASLADLPACPFLSQNGVGTLSNREIT